MTNIEFKFSLILKFLTGRWSVHLVGDQTRIMHKTWFVTPLILSTKKMAEWVEQNMDWWKKLLPFYLIMVLKEGRKARF